MKREIKFRAWDGNLMIQLVAYKQRYDYENGVVFAFSDSYAEFYAHENHESHSAEFEIMQYTGLKDKNGKEAYNGDIVNVTNKGLYNGNRVIVWDDILLSHVLVWASEYGRWQNSSQGMTYLKVSSGIKCEIIGNIYENPELLNS